MAIYNDQFSEEVIKAFTKAIEENSERASYEIDVAGGFADPPLLLQSRFISSPENQDLVDQIAKYCIKGRLVTIRLDGEVVGSPFQINNLNDSWDIISTLRDHPLAFNLILNNAAAFVLKKHVPPLKKGNQAPGMAAKTN